MSGADARTQTLADGRQVHEVAGPSFSGVETAAGISVGVISLLVGGLLPMLLGALADEHRISAAAIGQAATLEALSTGVCTGLAGAFIKPRRLRAIGVVSALLLTALNLVTTQEQGVAVLLIRGLAGAPEGMLLWICVSMISRTTTPERWAGVLYTGMTGSQLVFALAFAGFLLPSYHANGAFVAIALASLLAIVPSLMLPKRYGPLPGASDSSGSPPLGGWVALLGALLFVAAGSAVGIYALPIAEQAGLAPGVGQTAIAVSLVFQVLGGVLATLLAGRVHYRTVFLAATLALLACWAIYASRPDAAAFIGASGLGGLAALIVGPFFVPMLIEADPSRRAALQSGGAQLLGGALGPLMASLLIRGQDVRAVLVIGPVLLVAGMGVILLRGLLHHPNPLDEPKA